jgi:superfamily II DNA/RNA helicase
MLLSECDITVTPIHGDLSFDSRQLSLNKFKSGRARVLVATDVASRGLDVKNVTHVINYDICTNSDDYVHRIGRTGRAGMKGTALTLLSVDVDEEKRRLDAVEKLIGIKLEKLTKTKLQEIF